MAYIEGWYIEAALRRQGFGAALVSAGERWARQQGVKEVASDAAIANDGSISAHTALGYQEAARIVCFRKGLGDAG